MKHILRKPGAHVRAHAVTIAVMRGMFRLQDWTDGSEAYRKGAYV